MLAPGAELVGYGLYFRVDLGWLAYGVICLGVLVASVGGSVYRWTQERTERWVDRWEAEPRSVPPEVALAQAWRRFWWSLATMFALGAFSLWRVQMTVWRPVGERYYFLPADTWLGRLEHSWFNDALYAFGMVGILYVLYTLKEFLGSRFGQVTDPLLRAADTQSSEERWVDHQAGPS